VKKLLSCDGRKGKPINRIIDIFTGVTCYSLQNHLRTTLTDIGQVEVVLFEFVQTEEGVRVTSERHYRLVSPDEITTEELEEYRRHTS
jgi:hypothetical protein